MNRQCPTLRTVQRLVHGLFYIFALLLASGSAAHAEMLTLTKAQTTIFVGGHSVSAEADLPYNWDIRNAGKPGWAKFDLHFAVAELPVEPWGTYLPSVGNAYDVFLNGTLLQRQGDLVHPNGADYSKIPRFVVISPNLLQHSNVLTVHIRVDAERRGGLSEIYVGPEPEAYAAYQHSYNWRGNGSLIVVVFSLVVGLLALVLWATQIDHLHPDGAQRDHLYLFAALAELCWTLAVSDALIEVPPLAWPWWSAVPAAGAAAWACNIQLFSIEVAGWRMRPFVIWFRRWLMLLIALSAVLPLWAAGQEAPLALMAWHVALAVTFLSFGTHYLWSAIGSKSWAHRLVAATLLANLLVGILDLCNFRLFPSFPDNSLLRFSSLLFGMSLACIVIVRFKVARTEVGSLLVTLSDRIAAKELNLRKTYDKLEIQAREQERIAEPGRILRDMHDGVGSHLTLAIRQLQSDVDSNAPSNHSEVLHTLSDALDHLKLTIDAINLPHGDITALLANLRYRLEPRMAASGIALVWDVDLLQVENRLETQAMRHLQFMLYEALSNVVQHARATVVRIEAHAQPIGTDSNHHCVVIRVIDDGKGFDMQASQRKGLASMYGRASAIGAELSIKSKPSGTVVQIQLGQR